MLEWGWEAGPGVVYVWEKGVSTLPSRGSQRKRVLWIGKVGGVGGGCS